MVKHYKVKFRSPGRAVAASDLQVLGSDSMDLKKQASLIRRSFLSLCLLVKSTT